MPTSFLAQQAFWTLMHASLQQHQSPLAKTSVRENNVIDTVCNAITQ